MEASHFYDNAVVDLEQDVTACEGMLRLLRPIELSKNIYYSDLLDSCIWSLLCLTWRSGGRETDIFVCKSRLLNLLHQLVFLEHTWDVLARCFQLALRWGSSKRQRLEHYGSRCPAKPRVRPWKLGGMISIESIRKDSGDGRKHPDSILGQCCMCQTCSHHKVLQAQDRNIRS